MHRLPPNKTPLRSLLFVPGDSEKMMARATESGADVVIFDLEDAVAPGAKSQARALVAARLSANKAARIAVRLNAQDTDEYLADLAAIVPGAPDYVMLPKCGGAGDLFRIDFELSALECAFGLANGAIGVIPLVTESARAVRNLDYRDAPARVAALAFAGEDLASDLGVEARSRSGELNPLLADARRQVAIAASAAGLPAIDTPFPDHRNPNGLEAEANGAALLGYAGKLCIHPGQVPAVREIFSPSAERIAWATAVLEAFRAEGAAGVAVVAGKMVDKAHLRLAERIMAGAAEDD